MQFFTFQNLYLRIIQCLSYVLATSYMLKFISSICKHIFLSYMIFFKKIRYIYFYKFFYLISLLFPNSYTFWNENTILVLLFSLIYIKTASNVKLFWLFLFFHLDYICCKFFFVLHLFILY